MVRPRFASRSPLAVESLERRDCPAAVAVLGGGRIAEGGDSTVLTVRLSAPDAKAVQVGYIISGDGTRPAVVAADYRLTIGTQALAGPSGTIEFKPGETVKQIRVTAIDDALREGTESLRFKLFRPLGCTIDAASASVDVTARDNDDYTAALVPQGTSRIAEGASAPFVLELSKPATKAETFYVSTQNGSATTADYRPLRDMPVTILAGQSRSQPFSISTLKDADATETDEYFLLTARARSTDSPAIDPIGVTIIGARPATVALTVTDASVKEGNTGFATGTFTVRLNAPAVDPITVQYATAPGTATSGVDYVAAQGSLVFTRGQISKTVTVNVIGDAAIEGNETFQLIATATGGATATGTGTILDDDTAFRIDVVFPDSTLTASQRQAFRLAADRWSQIITADLPDVAINGRTIDDLEITATAPFIDGPNGILGQAGPRDMRTSGTQLPYTGVMRFDSADLAMMESSGLLKNVILHEMGHVLGIGSLWEVRNLVDLTDATNPLYVGTNGLREYRALTSSTNVTGVPVENTGGPGTAGSHWRDSVFRTELMTGYAEPAGVVMPISRLTIGSLQDLGYTVNYAAADPYVLPAPAAATNVIRSSTATSSNQRLFALVASSGADFLAAAMRQLGSDSTPTTTPRQRAFAGGVRV
jgi:hypothetical protein